ncbi:alginate O-acetyltransferase AlgX-related protein [Paraburkholderia caballeronis]|uniref:alginate O-acetyltransferase AlgX-related protein n=1 Tax=Paraburkholderia caballeronis TaxID=416943 RepID=UPI001416EF5E|nr:hypothetical protein [Paraburkholderia caballeronis]
MEKPKNNNVLYGKDGYIFLQNDKNQTQEQISGRLKLSGRDLRAWSTLFDLRKSWFKDRSIGYHYMAAPCKECVYEDSLPEGLSVSAERPIRQLIDFLGKHDIFDIVYPLDALKDAARVKATYSKGDTHWNYYGGFVAYVELMRSINRSRASSGLDELKILGEAEIDFYDEVVESDLSIKIGFTDLVTQGKIRNPGARLVEKNEVPNIGGYRVFENKNSALPRAVLFRDSFSNYTVRYLAESFSRLVVVWQPNIDYSIIKKENPDIVISQQAERFMVVVPDELGGATNRGYVGGKVDKGLITAEQARVVKLAAA